ncbi:hypothetical protein Lesp02_22120 [Lentzea sp. NBRC 105346]|uniref:hypothetical protein n=1 Tax=Lentzea sp. NBRC 105346 TaxID=3032205 RepID=UPI0024A3B0FE|nr:hypothetical protein [Lentzea sp. NBRC 105346]GLZ30022.1 hypothetical protein Lesp02_22120 [Lentzea sp. NBRC 105346]
MFSKIASVLGAGVLAVGGMVLAASPATAAETNPHCAQSTKIGDTGAIMSGGVQIGSVKQFKGCGKNWSYTYVWDGFRSSHSNFQVCVSVASGRGPRFDLEDLSCFGNKKDNWSSGADTLTKCTHAVGTISWGSNEKSGKTDIRC